MPSGHNAAVFLSVRRGHDQPDMICEEYFAWPRAPLELPYMQFELHPQCWYAVVFILALVHISVMAAGLLCSNHLICKVCDIYTISTSKSSDDHSFPFPPSYTVNSWNNAGRRSLIMSSNDLDRTSSSVPYLWALPNIRPTRLSTRNMN